MLRSKSWSNGLNPLEFHPCPVDVDVVGAGPILISTMGIPSISEEGSLVMADRTNRGSAPGRERDAVQRPGSFKPGHEKRGGRKRGTPNAIGSDCGKAVLRAAYHVGENGAGQHGLVGYCRWLALHHPVPFSGLILLRLLALECAESNPPERSLPTMEEVNQSVREYVGLTGEEQTKKSAVPPKSRAPGDWTGQDFPISSLMQIAVANPRAFCKLLAAILPQPPTAWQRGLRARRAWEQRQV